MSTFSFEEVSLSIDRIPTGFQIKVKAKLYGKIIKEPHIGYVVGVIMLDDDSGEVPNPDNTFYGPTIVLSSRQLQTDARGNFLAVNFDFAQSALRMNGDLAPNNPDEWKARVYLAGSTPMENLANKVSNTVVITA
ncbi:MAG: hypothetical protein EBS07_10335 [Sphingobacteriia bacterium]|nr:hypothetical protein [Sphingobacteriia bacterium]